MITEEQFDAIYKQSLTRLDAYIATQVTENQIQSAKNHKNSVVINRGYYLNLTKTNAEPFYLCACCGKMEAANFNEPIKLQMLAGQICFHCNYWKNLTNKDDPGRLVINGHVYSDGGNQPGARCDYLGFGGHVWKIERDGKVWETNNLWSGSTIPQEFIHLIPDNARFAS